MTFKDKITIIKHICPDCNNEMPNAYICDVCCCQYVKRQQTNEEYIKIQKVKDAIDKLTHTNTSDIEGLIETEKLKRELGLEK